MSTPQASDRKWMWHALELAERGRGLVEPNPLVGAVIVRGQKPIGAGWHERYGAVHAETNALVAAGAGARGATLYVTLEPCSHQGKTPPCTTAILSAGIGRVVAALRDPNPQVAGEGARLLRDAGVSVDLGLCAENARRQNAPYLKLIGSGRPYVHAKWAMTLDGKIATRTGQSKWISSAASRGYVHTLRGRMDAVVIGAGTALADDPLLTVRPAGPRTPSRVVVLGKRRLDSGCRLLQTQDAAPLLLFGPEEATYPAGCENVTLSGPGGRVDVAGLLDELGRRRMTNILVEGGSTLLGSFLDAGAIDEVHVFIAPRFVGGAKALGPIGGQGVSEIAEGLALAEWHFESIGGDLLIHGWR
jgi:diaminohydroxyphosphoribosylaminopyrimidine deaminase/5-amino-6-(5-phosphoribosylamino)uracil reductase